MNERFILNLTQHPASPEQQAVGVRNLKEEDLPLLQQTLTFEEFEGVDFPSEMFNRALIILDLVKLYQAEFVMIGGAPFFMSTLELVLKSHCVVLYAFTKRVVEEKDGKKLSVFKQEGFIRA